MSDVATSTTGGDSGSAVEMTITEDSEKERLSSVADRFDELKQWCKTRPMLKHLAHNLVKIRDGLKVWVALQKRAGLAGKVVVGPVRGERADEYISVNSLDDVDRLLSAVLDIIVRDLPFASRARTKEFVIGVVDADASSGRVWSAVARENEDFSNRYSRKAGGSKNLEADATAAAVEAHISPEGPKLPTWLAAEMEEWGGSSSLKRIRALRVVGKTIEGAVCYDGPVYCEYDDSDDDDHAVQIDCCSQIVIALAEPLWALADDGEDWKVSGSEGAALYGPNGEGTVRFDLFTWSADGLASLVGIVPGCDSAADFPAVSKVQFLEPLKRWFELGEQPLLYARSTPTKEQTKTDFLVPGVIAKGVVTVLAASPGAGKSALMLHAVRLTAIPPDRRGSEISFLGVPAEQVGHGMAVLVTAEETHAELAQRLSLMRVGQSSAMLVPCNGADIDEIIAELEGLPNLALVVFDSMRRFCDGDLDRNEIVTPWMDKLQAFAHRKGCAVVVIHHLNKGAGRKPGGLIDDVHGSGAIASNARIVLTMRKRAGGVVSVKVELSKLADVKERELGPFVRDEETWTLAAAGTQVEQKPVQRTETNSLVVSALKAVLGESERVTRTGRRELYELKRPELASLSRAKIRAEINEAILSGQVRLEDDGSIAMSSSA